MATLEELYGNKPEKILLYGRPGCGKTALAATLGSFCEYIDLDDGLLTALRLDDALRPMRIQVTPTRIVDENPMQCTAFNRLKQRVVDVANLCSTNRYPKQAVVVDSLTSVALAAIRMVVGSTGVATRMPTQQEWGIIINELKNFTLLLKSLPVVVILTAHQQTSVVDDTELVEIGVPGKKLPAEIASFFGEIWYMRAIAKSAADGGGFGYSIQSRQTAGVMARSRINIKDRLDANLGMVKILEGTGFKFKPLVEPPKPSVAAPTATVIPAKPVVAPTPVAGKVG